MQGPHGRETLYLPVWEMYGTMERRTKDMFSDAEGLQQGTAVLSGVGSVWNAGTRVRYVWLDGHGRFAPSGRWTPQIGTQRGR